MGTVKLAAALPKEPELNGLMDHAGKLLRGPDDEYIIIARVGVKQIVDDRWEGVRVPVIGIVAAELATGEDEDRARRLMAHAKDLRYARARMPVVAPPLFTASGLVTGRVDHETGEKLEP